MPQFCLFDYFTININSIDGDSIDNYYMQFHLRLLLTVDANDIIGIYLSIYAVDNIFDNVAYVFVIRKCFFILGNT